MSYENTTWGKHRTASLPALNNRYRLTKLREFLGVTHLSGKTLDIGAENFIGKSLGITDNTMGDLNYELNAPQELYDTILCLEVINHLFNSGILLDNIKMHLSRGGRLYISTPRLWGIVIPHGRGNFMELIHRNMKELLEYKGFKILRHKTYRSYPLRFFFYGFRPMIKVWLHRYTIFECELA